MLKGAKESSTASFDGRMTRRMLVSRGTLSVATVLAASFLTACGSETDDARPARSSSGQDSEKNKSKKGSNSTAKIDEKTDIEPDQPETEGSEHDQHDDHEGIDQGEEIEVEAENNTQGEGKLDPGADKPEKNVVGAKATGFFARGAPKLTEEQIQGKKPINATCEGTSHTLVISLEALNRLAKGEKVEIESSQNPHPGNPSNHAHVIVYEPIFG